MDRWLEKCRHPFAPIDLDSMVLQAKQAFDRHATNERAKQQEKRSLSRIKPHFNMKDWIAAGMPACVERPDGSSAVFRYIDGATRDERWAQYEAERDYILAGTQAANDKIYSVKAKIRSNIEKRGKPAGTPPAPSGIDGDIGEERPKKDYPVNPSTWGLEIYKIRFKHDKMTTSFQNCAQEYEEIKVARSKAWQWDIISVLRMIELRYGRSVFLNELASNKGVWERQFEKYPYSMNSAWQRREIFKDFVLKWRAE